MSRRRTAPYTAVMRLWGLTGGIASGKSTVARLLRRHGTPVVDADELYHALIAPIDGNFSPLTLAIGDTFGAAVLTPEKTLDRKALAGRIFSDPKARQLIESITHPAIAQAADLAFAKLNAADHDLAFYDVPLLYERQMEGRFEKVMVVWVPRHMQVKRLQARDGLSVEQAEMRLASQQSLDEKRQKADFVIDNSGDQEALQTQLLAFVSQVSRDKPSA